MKKGKFATFATLFGLGILSSGAANAQDSVRLLQVENFVGRIDLQTSNNPNIVVSVIPGRKANANMRQEGQTMRISGNFARIHNMNCNTRNGRAVLTINGTRYEAEDLPLISGSISSANGLRIINSELSGAIGNVGGVKMDISGCGDLVIGNIRQDLDASISGSGSLRTGDIGANAKIDISGSGDAEIRNIGNNLHLEVSGSGDFTAGNIGADAKIEATGSSEITIAAAREIDAEITGSGTLTINGGRSHLTADISGSGDIIHKGTAISPVVEIAGSGDVKFSHIEGAARISKN